MTRDEAEKYVIKHAMFASDSPRKPYFVRYPAPYSPAVFFSDDTSDLVEWVLNKANNPKENPA